jgi:phospholipid/cholesterol/gamma-HCH transport system substrate-binding protein
MARRNAAEVLTGAVVLLVAAGFLGYAVAHSGRGSVAGYPLIAKFDSIAGLPVGADVRMAGVKVGSVLTERIDPQSYLAVVTLSVQNGLALPKDSSAQIASESLLGGKYLSLSAGGDQTMLQPGQVITITQSSVSLEQLLGKFIFSVTDLVGAMKPTPGSGQPQGTKPQGTTPQGTTPQGTTPQGTTPTGATSPGAASGAPLGAPTEGVAPK